MSKGTQITAPKPHIVAGDTKKTHDEDGNKLSSHEMIKKAIERGVIVDFGDSFTQAGELVAPAPPPFRATNMLRPHEVAEHAAEQDAADKDAAESDGKKTVEQWAVLKKDVRPGYMNPILAGARTCNHWAVGTRLTEEDYALGLRIAGAVPIGAPAVKPSVMAVAKPLPAASSPTPPADSAETK